MTPITIALLILTTGAAAYFAARLFLIRSSLRSARRQLERINISHPTNERLSCSVPIRELEELLAETNRTLDQSHNSRINLEQKERELRKQIANVSHDLRTPLTSILGYLELLEDGELTEQERGDYLAIVRRRSKALQELIAAFYDLSRLESGEYPLTLEALSLTPLLCDALALFYREFEKTGLHVETRISETLPAISADESAVRRVFYNLIQNALNHGSGTVLIEQRLMPHPPGDGQSSPGSGKAQILTRISNQAPRLSEEDASRVFERFFTADEMRTGQNTGLGMTIAQRLLAQMGHQISARLETSSGTSLFIVEILWTPL